MEASTKDLRLHTRKLLAALERGEEVVITWHGKRYARLTSWRQEERGAGERNPAFGLWSDRTGDVDAEVRALRQGRELP